MTWDLPSKETWLEKIKQQRRGADPHGLLSHTTLDDIDIETLYVDSSTQKMAFSDRPWNRCQSYNHMNPVDLNKSILHDLKGGANGIWLNMDTGRDDVPNGDGASLWNLECWDQALQDVYLEAVPLHIHGSIGDALSLLASIQERKIDPMMLGLGLDPCGFFAQRGFLPASFPKIFALIHKIYAHCTHTQLKTKIMRIDTSPYHNAGAHTRTELSVMLATTAEYLRSSQLTPQELSDQLVFSIPVGRNIPENIAKLRAARLLIQAVFSSCGVDHTPYIHAQTSQRMMSIHDPWTNMLRTTYAAFSAAVSKADSISVLPYDFRLRTHTELGRRVARNTHNILAEECGLDIRDDVVHGAHLFEQRTQLLMQHAWDDFQELERKGGIVSALQNGTMHKKVHLEHQKRKSWISSGALPIVGTTHFPQVEDVPTMMHPDLSQEKKRIQEYIWSRGEGPTIGGSGVGSYLSQLHSGATRFEIDQGLFFRSEITTAALPNLPDALPFEQLRAKPEKKIPLILLGEERKWSARAQFAQQLLLSGGIIAQKIPFEEYTPSSSHRFVVLCGADSDYAHALTQLRDNSCSVILVTPKTNEDAWGFMHQQCNRITLLKCIHAEAL